MFYVSITSDVTAFLLIAVLFLWNRMLGDRAAEAKCCGNLTHVLKILRRHDDAATYGEHQIALLRSLRDRVGESRALFALASVYHEKAKHVAARSATLTRAPSMSNLPANVSVSMPLDAALNATMSRTASLVASDVRDSPGRPVSYPVLENETAEPLQVLRRAFTLYQYVLCI